MIARRMFTTAQPVLRISKSSLRKVPAHTEQIPDVKTFLTIIGRKCDEFTDTYENKWENLFAWDSKVLKEKGVPTQQRKYILSQIEKIRKNEAIEAIKPGKKSFLGGERKRKEVVAKMRAQERNS